MEENKTSKAARKRNSYAQVGGGKNTCNPIYLTERKSMKIIIKEAITYNDIKKYLPKCYRDPFPVNINMEEEYINIVLFPCNRKAVITSRYIQKVLQKLKASTLRTVYFAYCLSTEAKALIRENNGLVFGVHNYEWEEESWITYKGGC